LEAQTDAPDDEGRSDVVSAPLPARLTIHVLATTPEGTRCALAAAGRLTRGLDARVVLLVPRPTSLVAPFDPANQERAATIDLHRALAADVGVHVTVLFCVCHRPADVVHQMLGRSALVIVGGRGSAWWPGPEQQLVRRLAGEGYPVVFADVRAARNGGLVPVEFLSTF
jgi:hypothetical protein